MEKAEAKSTERKRPVTSNNVRRSLPSKRLKTGGEIASWSTVMTPELISKVAIFLNVGSELLNLCTIVGKVTSRIVRTAYLTDNLDYLDCHRLADVKKRVEHWMIVNRDWRSRCHGAKCAKNVRATLLKATDAKAMSFRWHLGDICYWNYYANKRSGGHQVIQDDAIVSINGISVFGMSPKRVEDILSDAAAEGKAIALKYMPRPALFFSNPLYAIRYDLVEVLKYMVQSKLFNVNDKKPIQSNGVPNDSSTEVVSLFWHSLDNHKWDRGFECFKYLLTLEETKVNEVHPVDGIAPIHFCCYEPSIPPHALQALLSNPRTRINARDSEGGTAIFILLIVQDDTTHKIRMEKLRSLLDAGADLTMPVANDDLRTPEEYVMILIEDEMDHLAAYYDEDPEILHEYMGILGMLRYFTRRIQRNNVADADVS